MQSHQEKIAVNSHTHRKSPLPHSLHSLAQELPCREGDWSRCPDPCHGPSGQIQVILADLDVLALGPGSLDHNLRALHDVQIPYDEVVGAATPESQPKPKVSCMRLLLPMERPVKQLRNSSARETELGSSAIMFTFGPSSPHFEPFFSSTSLRSVTVSRTCTNRIIIFSRSSSPCRLAQSSRLFARWPNPQGRTVPCSSRSLGSQSAYPTNQELVCWFSLPMLTQASTHLYLFSGSEIPTSSRGLFKASQLFSRLRVSGALVEGLS